MVAANTVSAATTLPSLHALFSPPHCRASTRQMSEVKRSRVPRGSSRMINWPQVIFFPDVDIVDSMLLGR